MMYKDIPNTILWIHLYHDIPSVHLQLPTHASNHVNSDAEAAAKTTRAERPRATLNVRTLVADTCLTIVNFPSGFLTA